MSTSKNYRIPMYRCSLVRESCIVREERPIVRQPKDIRDVCAEVFKDADREALIVIMLDTKNRVIGVNVVSLGILDSSFVHPREVYKPAIISSAASIILSHNHPSGDPTPSPEDKRTTERISEAGKILGIDLLDHIIIGDNGAFVSLKERGYL